MSLLVYAGSFILVLMVCFWLIKDIKIILIVGVAGVVAFYSTNYILKDKDLSKESITNGLYSLQVKVARWCNWAETELNRIDNEVIEAGITESDRAHWRKVEKEREIGFVPDDKKDSVNR